MENNTRINPETGEELKRGFRKITIEFSGLKETINMPGWYSNNSNNGIHSKEDMKVSDRVINKLKAKKENLMLPNDIKKTRKKLNLTQFEAGQIVGGGPRAFQKYEKGDVLPSKAVSNLLTILDKKPDMIKLLK